MGQEAPPQTAGERFGRKLALISYPAAVGFRDGGSADGTFPMEKMTFLMFARSGLQRA